MSALRTGETVQDGPSFQVREATTVRLGPRGGRRRIRTAGGDACATGNAGVTEAEGPVDIGPTRTFQVREAVTVTLPPPHWAALTKQEE